MVGLRLQRARARTRRPHPLLGGGENCRAGPAEPDALPRRRFRRTRRFRFGFAERRSPIGRSKLALRGPGELHALVDVDAPVRPVWGRRRPLGRERAGRDQSREVGADRAAAYVGE